MARVTVTIEFPTWTAQQLKQAVADLDSLDDEVGISPDNVEAFDVLGAVYVSEMIPDHVIVESIIED